MDGIEIGLGALCRIIMYCICGSTVCCINCEWCIWNRTHKRLVNMIMGLNPLEFRHLFGIYNVRTVFIEWVCKSARIAHVREIVVVVVASSFACFSHPTAFNGNANNNSSSNINCYIRQLHMQALSHSSLQFFLSLVNISLSLSLCFVCMCLMLACLLLYAQSIQALRSSRVE